MLERRISALPVIKNDGKLVGNISEGDLVRRTETGTERKASWWLTLLRGTNQLVGEFLKLTEPRFRIVMTKEVVVANPDTSLREVARLFESNRIKRVSVVEGDRVVGVVSRANLLRALISASPHADAAQPSDSELRYWPTFRATMVYAPPHSALCGPPSCG